MSDNNQEKEPEENKPLRPYLEENISDVLQKALKELDEKRPDNPLEYLGNSVFCGLIMLLFVLNILLSGYDNQKGNIPLCM